MVVEHFLLVALKSTVRNIQPYALWHYNKYTSIVVSYSPFDSAQIIRNCSIAQVHNLVPYLPHEKIIYFFLLINLDKIQAYSWYCC